MYDYLIVGAGLAGATFAREAMDAGKTCLVIDRRNHIAGNCYTEKREGIMVHAYGPHAFHTNSEKIWRYVNRFATFNGYRHKVYAWTGKDMYSLPINLNTLSKLWGVDTPVAAQGALYRSLQETSGHDIESWCLRNIGQELYELFVRDYTAKQWDRHPRDLPESIIRRLPVRFDYNNDYNNDTWQGIPTEGYTKMVERMFDGADIELSIDYMAERAQLDRMAHKVFYSGPIDALFNYDEGRLEYRSLLFEHSVVECRDFQGTAQVNYMSPDVPWTRITEHKHFVPVSTPTTVITKEYSVSHGEPAYPIADKPNVELAERYQLRARTEGYIVGGRLAHYQYLDMHQVIGQVLSIAREELSQ